MLQDVTILMGLWIKGQAVTGPPCHDWRAMCSDLLGLTPDTHSLVLASLKLRWLQERFGHYPDPNILDVLVRRYAPAYMLP